MDRVWIVRPVLRLLVGMVLLALPLTAGAAEEPAVKVKADPKAEKILRQMADYIQGLKSFRTDVKTSLKIKAEGMNREMSLAHDLAVQRPNKLAMLLKDSERGATIVSDGKQAWTFIPEQRLYTVEEAPAKLEGLPGEMAGVGIGSGGMAFMDTLLQTDIYAHIMEGVEELKYAGTEEVGGEKAHRLTFIQEDINWDLWIAEGDKPFPRKMVPDLSAAAEEMPGAEVRMAVTLDNWKTETPEDLFAFNPPENARKVDSLMEDPDAPKHPLLGKAAPAFTMDLLGGGSVKLADLKGKVVVLDFWATWCGPCVQSLPLISGVMKKYKADEVAFYAVNVEESEGRVKNFLKQRKLEDVPVAMDEGEVSESYQVTGIPQTVVIDRDGKVHKVHQGFAPGMEKRLKKEVDALLNSKSANTRPAQGG